MIHDDANDTARRKGAGRKSARSGGAGDSDEPGQRIRKVRDERGMTLAALAATVGRSVGYLSQIERGISHPPLKDMVAISVALGVPLSSFLTNLDAASPIGHHAVVRGNSRRRITADGIVNESLIDRFMPNFEFMRSTIGPGVSTQAKQSPGDQSFEFGVIIEGQLDLHVNGETSHLAAGDSYTVQRSNKFFSTNNGTSDTVIVWCVLYN